MPLTRGQVRGYYPNTMTYRFDMRDGDREVQCGVSSAAMDDAERQANTQNHERNGQFTRLRDRIEEVAQRKYLAGQIEQGEPRVLITTRDLNR
jgi:Protein of unknown function (DUF1488)